MNGLEEGRGGRTGVKDTDTEMEKEREEESRREGKMKGKRG